jgi:hypothetical protein
MQKLFLYKKFLYLEEFYKHVLLNEMEDGYEENP